MSVSAFLDELDSVRCHWCGCLITEETGVHVDHVTPRSRGGSSEPANLVVSCRACNESKSARPSQEWRHEDPAASATPNTRRAYRSSWQHFVAWCEASGFAPLPATPETVALYLADLAETHKSATLRLRVAAVSQAHLAAGHDSPTRAALVRKALAITLSEKGNEQDDKTPVTLADLQAIRQHLRAGLMGPRDWALLLVGLAGGLRCSELVGIDVEHIEFVAEGVVITVPWTNTGERKVAMALGHSPATCPVQALRTWLAAARIESGAVFLSVKAPEQLGVQRLLGGDVARIVKHYMGAIGKGAGAYSGSSLRAGQEQYERDAAEAKAEDAGAELARLRSRGFWSRLFGTVH